MNNTPALPPSSETGQLGIFHLKRVWARHQLQKKGVTAENAHEEWPVDVELMNTLGIGIEQFIQKVYADDAGFETLETWVLQLNGGTPDMEKVTRFNRLFVGGKSVEDSPIPDILSAEELAFFDKQGYVIVRNAVTREAARAAEQAVWEFLGYDENNPQSWYAHHPAIKGIMVQLFQHPALEANRQSQRIKGAFQQLWQQEALWMNTDRVSFNPPETEQYEYQGPKMHWDVSLAPPVPFGLQSVLYLTDTAANQGAFTLVPGFHKKADAWVAGLPAGAHPRMQDLHALGSIPVAAEAGDCIIFHHALPHASRPNTARRPRIAQYIIWQPLEREIRNTWL
jgi:ectoine hydroxylase-related dioxygenase (phytanoyl-CoA dioxygenase family)